MLPDFTALLANWPQDIEAARAVQQELRHSIRLENDFSEIRMIAGVDASYHLVRNETRAVIAVMNIDDLKLRHHIVVSVPTAFPYIPGFLSFREIPAILTALAQLSELPDMLMVDGQGIAHPRRLGIAAHLGALTHLPAIGVAKSRLFGRYQEPREKAGDHTPLMDKDVQIGVVLRSKIRCKPLFISPGHRVDVPAALAITQQCLTRYRLPEPTRIADKISKSLD